MTVDRMAQGSIVPRERAPRPISIRASAICPSTCARRTSTASRAFYVDVLGFDVIAEARDVPGWGTTGDVLFLSWPAATTTTSGFNTGSFGRRPAAARRRHRASTTSPSTTRLGPGWPMPCAAGQQVDRGFASCPTTAPTWPVYISDPDGNDVELCWDRPPAEWALDDEGHIAFAMDAPLDVEALLRDEGLLGV